MKKAENIAMESVCDWMSNYRVSPTHASQKALTAIIASALKKYGNARVEAAAKEAELAANEAVGYDNDIDGVADRIRALKEEEE